MKITNEIERACGKFAGGFVPDGTEVIVVVSDGDEDLAKVKIRAQTAPTSPRDAVLAIAESCGIGMDDVNAVVYVICGGANGKQL